MVLHHCERGDDKGAGLVQFGRKRSSSRNDSDLISDQHEPFKNSVTMKTLIIFVEKRVPPDFVTGNPCDYFSRC
jgi:hypothetical protein